MGEQTARIGDIELAYEVGGDPAGAPMLLIMGLGAQMILWPDDLVAELGARGFRTVRFDNRDCGRSTWIEGGPEPNPLAALAGDVSSASYTLEDMAADAAGLLDHLGIGEAHVVGASMGGMIAQTLAIRHPRRARSLASIMSTTGDRAVGMPKPEVLPALLTPPPATREGTVEWAERMFAIIGSPGFEPDREWVADVAGREFDRGQNPLGTARQLMAIAASGDRTQALRGVGAPAVVIHGAADPLVPISGGRATAEAIPGADLVVIEGMGHDLPRGAWPRIVDAIVANAQRATARDAARAS
ncbi:MAG: alpha/beta fold hydrolase [Solirubrobacteraceae bacterium]